MNDPATELALTRFDFTTGAARGSQLMLYPRCLVHRSDSHLETLPLARVTAIRVSFERDPRQLRWGATCVLIALFLLLIAPPLGSFAHGAAQEMAQSTQGVGRFLHGLFRFIEVTAAMLPAIALAGALGGAALGVLGWRGSTTLTVALGGAERSYRVRGRDTLLLDFAQIATERVMAIAR